MLDERGADLIPKKRLIRTIVGYVSSLLLCVLNSLSYSPTYINPAILAGLRDRVFFGFRPISGRRNSAFFQLPANILKNGTIWALYLLINVSYLCFFEFSFLQSNLYQVRCLKGFARSGVFRIRPISGDNNRLFLSIGVNCVLFFY